MAAIFGEGKIFLKIAVLKDYSVSKRGTTAEIALSHTVKEIEGNLCFAIFGKNSKIQNGRHFWGGENCLKSNPKILPKSLISQQATDPISLHTKFGDNSSNTFPLNERKPCVTPDIGRRTSDGEKSKNNISTPQGGGHNHALGIFWCGRI